MSRFVIFGKKEVKLYLPNDLEMQNRLVEWLQDLPASVVSLVDTGIFDGLSAEYSARDGITALSLTGERNVRIRIFSIYVRPILEMVREWSVT